MIETEDFDDAASRLASMVDVAGITRGESGSVVVSGDERVAIAVVPVDKVVDTTGAGDQYAAGFLLGLARGLSLEDAGKLGSLAAAEVIAHWGPRPMTSLEGLANVVFVDPDARVGDASYDLYRGGGTSYAAPQVSGAAAVVWSAFPYFDNDLVRQTLLGTAEGMQAAGVYFDLDACLSEVQPDVLMALRIQQERMLASYFPSEREYSRYWGVTEARMNSLPKHAIVMHPGPMNRGLEIESRVADSKQSTVLEQVANGLSVRMAVLYHLMSGEQI